MEKRTHGEDGGVKTPMLDKIKACEELSLDLGEFLEWLSGRFLLLDRSRKRAEDEQAVIDALGAGDNISIEKILADYFHIDLMEAERERAALLKAIRKDGEHGK